MKLNLIIVCVLTLGVFVLGYILARGGHPYSAALLTIHKLVPLVLGVVLIVFSIKTGRLKAAEKVDTALVSLFIAFFVISITSGGILSAKSGGDSVVLSITLFIASWIHKIGPYFAAGSGLLFYIRVF